MKAANEKVDEVEVRILKIAQCSSLSGNSTLTYHVGCSADSEIQFRLSANTASGFFSDDWVSITAIRKLFDKASADNSIRSSVLSPLFLGKSVNTPSFLFAVLKHEGFITQSSEPERKYELSEPTTFMAEVKALIESDTDLKVDDMPAGTATTVKKAARISSKPVPKPDDVDEKSPVADGNDKDAADAKPHMPRKKTAPKVNPRSQ